MSTFVTPIRPGLSRARTERRQGSIWVRLFLLTPLFLVAAGCATGYGYSYGAYPYSYSYPYDYSYPYYYNPYYYTPKGYYYYPYGPQYRYKGGQRFQRTVPRKGDGGAGIKRDRGVGGGMKDHGGGTRGRDGGKSGRGGGRGGHH